MLHKSKLHGVLMIYNILDSMLKDASGLHNNIKGLSNNPLAAWAINFWLCVHFTRSTSESQNNIPVLQNVSCVFHASQFRTK